MSKILSFKDWFDKYASEYNDEETDLSEDEWYESEYESYMSDYQDMAYEEYRDRQMWEE